ncbi:M23 family metallopeptidase [Nocardia sp. 2]|uniref:M23 family metallopeptidase n=2 Tax=Nocardia acididurans TaxID=2802282 RepID=A0ABS1MHH1_9NOCA|nr:M23 family metallopeptidase [Nocardia acididurans]
MLTATVVLVFLLGDDTGTCGPDTSAGKAAAAAGGGARTWPLAAGTYTISDVFGSRGGAHQGTDLAASAGTPIYAAMAGTVHEAGPASGFGIWIVVDHNEGGHTTSTVYGHMYASEVFVETGDQVSAGQQIAAVGSNGQSSGPHLHFEVWTGGGRLGGGTAIDPIPWLGAEPAPDSGQAPSTVDPAAAAANPTTTPPTTTPNTARECDKPGGGVDDLAPGMEIPAELEPLYRKAGTQCPQISSSLLAAQGKQESGFRRGLTSPSGAQGLAQFLPGTAASLAPDGQPYVIDADGNGTASVWDDADAINGQARYMCAIAATVDGWIAQGRVHHDGDVRELYLAAYNAGEGAVLRNGGFPVDHEDYIVQTRPYADIILATAQQYSNTLS